VLPFFALDCGDILPRRGAHVDNRRQTDGHLSALRHLMLPMPLAW
jgi:hypothetical protein